jgi:hypothetical protein
MSATPLPPVGKAALIGVPYTDEASPRSLVAWQ